MAGTRRRAILASLLIHAQVSAAHDREADARWLEEKSKKRGVKTLESGLRYKVLVSGEGWAKSPLEHTQCKLRYAGSLTPANGGKEFDSGELSIAPNGGIKAWKEALQLMKEGDTWEIYVPPELGYGDKASAKGIPDGAVLVFTMTLQEVNGKVWGKDFKRFEFPPKHKARKQDSRAVPPSDLGGLDDDDVPRFLDEAEADRVFGRLKTEL